MLEICVDDTQPFAGGIDEVRFWNTRQSAAAILNNMDSTLLGNEPGLVGQFSFNDGNAGADNTGMTVALDGTSNTNDGVLGQYLFSVRNGQVIPGTPEPSTWVMMGLGFACLGLVGRSKAKSLRTV